MSKSELAELLKYCNPKVLYVVAWNNVLKALFCPFKVLVVNDVGSLSKGSIVEVEMIKVTMGLKTVYIIDGKAYYYHHFDIIL